MDEEKIQQITQSTSVISEWSKAFLSGIGVSGQLLDIINLLFLIGISVVIVLLIYHITRYILRSVFDKMAQISKMSYLKHLRERRFPHYLSMIIPYSLVRGAIPIVFELYPSLASIGIKAADIYLVFYVIWLLMSAVKAFGDSLKVKDQLKDKPIDSYIQVVSIFFYFIAFIILFSIFSLRIFP